MTGPLPLLPLPKLSAAAAALAPADRDTQLGLALDAYESLETNPASDWPPAAMWHGCEGALLFWCGELARQMPYDRPIARRWQQAWGRAYSRSQMAVGPLPWWLGDRAFHLRCQSALIAADPATYGPQFVHAPIDLAYWWPTEEENTWHTES